MPVNIDTQGLITINQLNETRAKKVNLSKGEVVNAVCNIWKSKGEVPETAKNEFIEILKQLEGALGEKDFFGGDSFGFVDIIAIPLTCWFYAVEKFGGFKVENECPKFSAWMNNCTQRETVARILPDPEKVYEFVIMLRNMFGIE